jgi:hypothetical protein
MAHLTREKYTTTVNLVSLCLPQLRRSEVSDAPERIYLQWGGRGYEATWCEDRIDEGDEPDVEYVRADVAEKELAAAKATLTKIKEWASYEEDAPANSGGSAYDDARRWVKILVDRGG